MFTLGDSSEEEERKEEERLAFKKQVVQIVMPKAEALGLRMDEDGLEKQLKAEKDTVSLDLERGVAANVKAAVAKMLKEEEKEEGEEWAPKKKASKEEKALEYC